MLFIIVEVKLRSIKNSHSTSQLYILTTHPRGLIKLFVNIYFGFYHLFVIRMKVMTLIIVDSAAEALLSTVMQHLKKPEILCT